MMLINLSIDTVIIYEVSTTYGVWLFDSGTETKKTQVLPQESLGRETDLWTDKEVGPGPAGPCIQTEDLVVLGNHWGVPSRQMAGSLAAFEGEWVEQAWEQRDPPTPRFQKHVRT